MQTFLPYADYKQSAKVLDMKRLGKQRVEVLQLLNSITAIDRGLPIKGWKNHPCRKMWQNHKNALIEYGLTICDEWKSRGYKDTCWEKIHCHYDYTKSNDKPTFIGNEEFHLSHKSMLKQKKPEHYNVIWPDVPSNIEYVWLS